MHPLLNWFMTVVFVLMFACVIGMFEAVIAMARGTRWAFGKKPDSETQRR